MILYPEGLHIIQSINRFFESGSSSSLIDECYPKCGHFRVNNCMDIEDMSEIKTVTIFNIPITCQTHKNLIMNMYSTYTYALTKNKNWLEPKKEKMEEFFASSPELGGVNGLKQLINYLFRSSSFKAVPFPDLQSTASTASTTSNSIDICLSSNLINDKTELQNKFINFCQSICQQVVSEDDPLNSVKVYTISIFREEIPSTKPNPAYDIWKQQYDLIKDLDSKEPSVMEKLASLAASKPSEQLETFTIKKSVKSTSINTVHKEISTMYLSKKDKTTLNSLLHTFKNNKQKFQKLGLPNKLGILLHGKPGCGKTSTVIATATYLQKDIYYLNLNGVKTNEELSMLFDYVIKETSTSGIIVMEDIDAMTQVVHKREESNGCRAPTAAELISAADDPLTLEYFLNILQGTLTRENSVFIATTNHLNVLDPAFYRPGRFDIKIEMKPADHYQIEEIYKTFFERPINNDILEKIPEYTYTPAEFIFKFAEFILNPNASDEEILQEFCTL
jgi:hypothetical protein